MIGTPFGVGSDWERLFFLIIFFWFFVGLVRYFYYICRASDYACVTGKVINCKVTTSSGYIKKPNVLEVEYEYFFDNKSYANDKVSAVDVCFPKTLGNDKKVFGLLRRKVAVGGDVKVFVNKKNPKISFLYLNVQYSVIGLSTVASIVSLCLFCMSYFEYGLYR